MRILKIRYTLYFLFLSIIVCAEGTRETAPNGNITIDGNATNDIAALYINRDEFNNFASYNDVNVNSRLHIHISDPSSETIYMGFSRGAINSTFNLNINLSFEFRIKDPNGNIVYTNDIASTGVQDGLINNWSEAFNGPVELGNTGGYTAIQVTPADLMSQGFTTPGDYYIEFDRGNDSDFLIPYWDITVANTAGGTPQERKGRLWSYNWAFFAVNDFGFPERPFNGAFYVCAPDVVNPDEAFITRIDFNGSEFRPAAFNIAFNSFGITNTGNIIEDRKSFENGNRAVPEYAIFLNDPVDICKTSSPGDLSFNGITRCSKDDFCISFLSTKEGQLDVLIDFDGPDDVYTPGTRDVILSVEIRPDDVNKSTCIDWNGLDGLGNPVEESVATEIPISLSFAQGIYHFPIYDAELLINGFSIESVRPAGPTPKLFYDDTNIAAPSGLGEPNIQIDGCDLPCHVWDNYQSPGFVGFGNLNTINSWWFSQQTIRREVFSLPAYYECELEGPDVICQNETGELSVELILSPDDATAPDVEFSWAGPSFVGNTDDLTVEIDGEGEYMFQAMWIAPSGDTCFTTCNKVIEFTPVLEGRIDTLIEFGDNVEINNEVYDQEGTYTQTFETGEGCDSLLIITVEVFFDVELTCEILGPDNICIGDSVTLSVEVTKMPDMAPDPVIDLIRWSGPSIVSPMFGEEIIVNGDGTYSVDVVYQNEIGENKRTSCTKDIDLIQPSFSQIDTSGFLGDEIVINGEVYDRTGQYEQVTIASNGCDSIITIIVNLLEPEYICDITGPTEICENSSAELTLSFFTSPPNAPIPNYDVIQWSGPGFNNITGEVITVQDAGNYDATLRWTNVVGETRSTSCDFALDIIPDSEESIDVFIFEGDSITINNETYTEEGEYDQQLTSVNGCDSLLIINVRVENSVLYYDFNDCRSTDYSRFTGETADDLSCAHITATNVYRENPAVNAHSCTPGVRDVAMCVDALDSCEYDAGNEKSIIFEMYVDPVEGQELTVSGISFYQKAPPMFEWVVGQTGLNNFPTRYGIRILKNDVEIFRQTDINTSFLWTKESFVFGNMSDFIVTEASVFRFEILPYCLIGNDADVAAWDIDELNVVAGCADDMSRVDIVGAIKTYEGNPIPEALVRVQMANDSYNIIEDITDQYGHYAFSNLPSAMNYTLSASKDNNYLDGVSTLDLVIMQKHILGIEGFDNPYNYIAADIDNSQSITAIDLIELRKLILGIYEELPDNTSWKFGDNSQRLSIDNPFALKEEKRLFGIGEANNMIGIKIGDVNGDNSLEKRTYRNVQLSMEKEVIDSEQTLYEVKLLEDLDIVGLQMRLHVPDFEELISGAIVLTEFDYYFDAATELLTISFAPSFSSQLKTDATLFSIITLGDSPELHQSDLIKNEAYIGKELEVRNIAWNETVVEVSAISDIRVQPNPFTDNTTLYFSIASDQVVSFDFMDETGRLLYRTQDIYSKGNSVIELNKVQLSSKTGLVYCRISTKDYTEVVKLLIIE